MRGNLLTIMPDKIVTHQWAITDIGDHNKAPLTVLEWEKPYNRILHDAIDRWLFLNTDISKRSCIWTSTEED